MRRTAATIPIYESSSVLLSWFAGEEALELEGLSDSAIAEGVSEIMAGFLGNGSGKFLVENVLKKQWGNEPLFLGSYSYVAVGSSGDDLDKMAEPLPRVETQCDEKNMFTGEIETQVHDAGHMVPMDQPKAALEMLRTWMHGNLAMDETEEIISPH